jgi:threonine/homoserine/homoserine lactone efflux protein
MLVLGGVAGAIMVLSLLLTLSFVFSLFGLPDVFYLIAVAAAIAMAWSGWQAFQAEGGKFQLGTGTSSPAEADSAAASAPAAAPLATEPAPAPADATADEASAPLVSDGDADEDRPREA